MSVNTKGIMRDTVLVEDIVKVIEGKLESKVRVESTHYSEYKVLVFTYNGEERRMSVFTNHTDTIHYQEMIDEETITLIDLNAWGASVEIINSILEVFGGILIKLDTSDDWERIHPLDDSDYDFNLTDVRVTFVDGYVINLSIRDMRDLVSKLEAKRIDIDQILSIRFTQ
jgi:hypothetical protein